MINKLLKLDNKYNFFKNYLKNLKLIKENNIYKGKIINILEDYVIINYGGKFEGTININEFKKKKIKIGDIINIIILKLDYNGECIISYKKAEYYKNWIKIINDYKTKRILKGKIVNKTKGGLIIKIYNNILSFLPGSQIDNSIINNYENNINSTIDVQIININYINNNIIVSHKILIDQDLENKKYNLIVGFHKGKIVYGKIKYLTSYGAFVDINNLEGLLHVNDIKKNQLKKFKIGQLYKFIVLSIDKKIFRIQLGLKKKKKWNLLIKKINIGSIIKGRVNKIKDYGILVYIKYGIEGLLQFSEISWYYKKSIIKINEIIKCKIINIDENKKKILLSIKQLHKDPFNKLIKKYQIGTIHKCKIINKNLILKLKNKFNCFFYLLDKVLCNEKEIIKLIVYYIDNKIRKIFLTTKIIDNKEWKKYKNIYKVNSIHNGKIKYIYKNYYFIINKRHEDLILFMNIEINKYIINSLINFKVLNINYPNIMVLPVLQKYTLGDYNELTIIKNLLEEEEKINNEKNINDKINNENNINDKINNENNINDKINNEKNINDKINNEKNINDKINNENNINDKINNEKNINDKK
ncbi:S1 RNA-binding domain-containing protein [Candidatus Shikimatogenerans bostrichidophilus]|uniref:S1 RNA-binding domain-containing protein n=1 Tax=Candidatus Shikimatogenerans bostrichidophilus TaxID=2943807 RepID=UPI002967427A